MRLFQLPPVCSLSLLYTVVSTLVHCSTTSVYCTTVQTWVYIDWLYTECIQCTFIHTHRHTRSALNRRTHTDTESEVRVDVYVREWTNKQEQIINETNETKITFNEETFICTNASHFIGAHHTVSLWRGRRAISQRTGAVEGAIALADKLFTQRQVYRDETKNRSQENNNKVAKAAVR